MKQQLRKGKKWLSLFLAMVMLLACLPSGALAAGGDSPDPGIQSVTGITKMSIWGQQLAAVAIEYGSQVDPGSISEDSYDVKALVADTDGEVASAPIAAVYTNAAPETLEDRESVPGRYVIVELDVDFSDGTNLDNKIGRLVTTYYENGGKILEYWCCDDDMDYLQATAEQKSEVKTVDGTAVKASDPVRVDTWVNVGMDDFDSMTLINPDQSEEYQQLHINYYLPEGYDGESGTQYPLIIQLVGGGCSYYEKTLSDGTVINNNGTNLAFDPSALTWLDSPEPIIIAAVHTRFVMGGGYDGASDIIMAAEYLRDNFNVDPGRIYLTGNSAGTNNGGLAVQQRPDLFAACILCNGNPFQVNCGKNPFTGATSEPYGMKEEVIQTMTENRIPLFFCHGIGDSMANYYESYKPYQELYQAYTAAGEELVYELEGEADAYTSVDPKTDEEATQLLRIRLFSTDEMDAVGVTNYHGATKYAYYKHGQELMKWALAQSKSGAEPEQPTAPAMSFVDVSEKDWFYNAVAYAYENGLMSGTSATTFAPNDKLTRAMVAQVIYNLEGTPAVSGTQFTDVAAGMWYTNAITWAAQNGLVSGYGDGKFGPNDLVTREQLAVILNHYAQFKKMTAAATGSLAAFTDGSEASGWAVNALIWAVDNGVMAGKGNSTLDPKGTATRAEVAQMFMNFLEA